MNEIEQATVPTTRGRRDGHLRSITHGWPGSILEQVKGHFAAWEQPELFAAELRAAFRSLR